jgi:hypothetical protein
MASESTAKCRNIVLCRCNNFVPAWLAAAGAARSFALGWLIIFSCVLAIQAALGCCWSFGGH